MWRNLLIAEAYCTYACLAVGREEQEEEEKEEMAMEEEEEEEEETRNFGRHATLINYAHEILPRIHDYFGPFYPHMI